MGLFSAQKDSDCMLIFDIGSGSVGGAILLASATHTPSLLYSFRSEIPLHSNTTGRRLLSHMLRSLSEVVLAVTEEGFKVAGFGANPPRITEVFISLSAPWIISKTSFLSLHNEKPELLTPAVFTTLLEHSRAERIPQEPGMQNCIEIEQKLIKAVLNGYETAVPYGKKASDVDFAVFGSFSVARITEQIAETISRHIHAKHSSFHSFSMIAFAVLRELYPKEESFLIVDISGEQTEISIVKNRILVEMMTFPSAKNHLLRLLERGSSVPFSGTTTMLKLHTENGSMGPMAEKIARSIEQAKKEWLGKFSEALSTFSTEVFLPHRVFLTADDDVSPIFAQAIHEGSFSRFAMSAALFDVTELRNDPLASLVSWSPAQAPDVFISLIAAVANRLRR